MPHDGAAQSPSEGDESVEEVGRQTSQGVVKAEADLQRLQIT